MHLQFNSPGRRERNWIYRNQVVAAPIIGALKTNHIDVADAAYRVGYESTTQFSREYSRMFGFSPREDMKRLNGKSTD